VSNENIQKSENVLYSLLIPLCHNQLNHLEILPAIFMEFYVGEKLLLL
jgi:hypothetical protein